jgi:hypothetical protein
MFTVKQQEAHGGDVQFYEIGAIPAGAKKVTTIEGRILARGETSGHAHILTGDVEIFELNGQLFAAVGKDGAFHQHYREADITKETFLVKENISNCDHTLECKVRPGKLYAIGIDRQYDPHAGGWKRNTD